ncbi:glutathione S-transferase family protein [Propionivibrio dicarboxylicus]|uniref:Glutathione S-transferase n=1 Tax=Propionivibrio dicarboxylicus TaxID=83767 RepID=A0A1G7W449_9RHOO|nr:glutathione S-transferase family protein [Propionivibrio dicarboxylicus]SDG66737.1 glutathione S-transferase [Propionivibrio dicarboxylicus]
MKLVIGDRNYSSWSLRPWLVLKQMGLSFEEIPIRLREAGTKAEILKYSPSGKVPCLIDGEIVVWDSLAICEYLAEKKPSLWPADAKARAEARAISAEMHSGFMALRHDMPMEVHAYKPHDGRTATAEADIARIVSIWQSCRKRFGQGGPFLFGEFSVADAMFAPVAWRFLTYAVSLPPEARAWVDMMAALPAMQAWRAGAIAEAAE